MRKPRLGETGFQASLKGEPRNYTVKLHSTVWKLGVKLGAAPGVREEWDESKRGRGQNDRGWFQGKPWLARLPLHVPPAVSGQGF